MTKIQMICNAMSELQQFIVYGQKQDKEMIVTHLQYQFRLIDREEALQIYEHMCTLVAKNS